MHYVQWRRSRSPQLESAKVTLPQEPPTSPVDPSSLDFRRADDVPACSKNTIFPDWSCCDDLKNQYSHNWFVTWVSDVFGWEFKSPLAFQRSLVNVIPDGFKHPGFSSTQMKEWKSDRIDASLTDHKSVLASWRSGSFLPSLCSCLTADGKGLFFWTAAAACQPADGPLRVRVPQRRPDRQSSWDHGGDKRLAVQAQTQESAPHLEWEWKKWAEDDHGKHLVHPHRPFYF